MHRAAAELPGEKAFCLANVDDAADGFAGVEARKGPSWPMSLNPRTSRNTAAVGAASSSIKVTP